MISTHEKGGRGTRGEGYGRGRPQCTYCKRMGYTQENCYSLHDFFDKEANISKSEVYEPKFSNEKYHKYLRLKSVSQTQSFTHSILSKACISQALERQSS